MPKTGIFKHLMRGKDANELEREITALWEKKWQEKHADLWQPGMDGGTTGQMLWPICTKWSWNYGREGEHECTLNQCQPAT